jgi:hypothetical protein
MFAIQPTVLPAAVIARFVAAGRHLVANTFSFSPAFVFSPLVRSYQLCCGRVVVGPATFFAADGAHGQLA